MRISKTTAFLAGMAVAVAAIKGPPAFDNLDLNKLNLNLRHSSALFTRLENIFGPQICDGALNVLNARAVELDNDDGSGGAGILLDGQYLLTANHVIEGVESVEIFGSLNGAIDVNGLEVTHDTPDDLALIKIDQDLQLPPLPVSPTALAEGATSQSYSFRTSSFLRGMSQGLTDDQKQDELIYIKGKGRIEHSGTNLSALQVFDRSIMHGDSGIGLVTCSGTLAGIVVQGASAPTDNGVYPNCPDSDDNDCHFDYGYNVNAEVINRFLAANWPNYGKAQGNFALNDPASQPPLDHYEPVQNSKKTKNL